MANGKLGAAVTTAAGYITVYTCPASGVDFATVTINAVNSGGAVAKVRVAITSAATPTAADWIEYDQELAASGGVLERACKLMSPGEKVMVYCDVATVAVRVEGLEKASA